MGPAAREAYGGRLPGEPSGSHPAQRHPNSDSFREYDSRFERDVSGPPSANPGQRFDVGGSPSRRYDTVSRPHPTVPGSGAGPSPAAQSSTVGPGSTVAQRYQLIDLVGKGGNGTVWRAKDTVLQREVALKEVIFPIGLPPDERHHLQERSIREAQIAAGLSHPSVVRVFDVVTHDGLPWIVMELLQSRSLSEILASDGPLPSRVVAKIGLALVGALQTAHEAGIVHRDVKPGNVLVSADGRCVLSDFGAAQAHHVSNGTTPGKVLGSAHYIAPERAIGGKADPPSDVFSLGVTLYSAVEGRPPFDRGDAVGTMRAVVHDPPESPLNAGPLTNLLAQMLSKDPGERLTLAEVRRELAGILSANPNDLPQEAAEPGPLPPPRRETPRDMPEPPGPKKSSKAKPVAILCVLLLVAGGLAFLLYMSALGNDDDLVADPGDDETSEDTDEQPDDDSDDGFDTAAHESEAGFTSNYPADWGEGPAGDDYVEYADPDDAEHWVRYYSNSWRIVEPSVEDFLTGMVDGLETSGHMTDVEILELDTTEIGGLSGHVIEYTGNLAETGEARHSIWGVVVADDGSGTGVYVSGSADQWEFSEQVYQEAADTFSFD